MELSSTAFLPGGQIPVEYTGDGSDVSPDLNWNHPPDKTREFALVCDDPDAPTNEPWVHWVVFKIPADCRRLPEAIGNHSAMKLPGGLLQGRNSWTSGNTVCYRGPAPPRGHGVHHYHFHLYALDKPVDLHGGVTKADFVNAIHGHVLEEAVLIGTYQR